MTETEENLKWAGDIFRDGFRDSEEERFWLEVGLSDADGLWYVRLRSNKRGVVMQSLQGFKHCSEAKVLAARILMLFPNTVEILKNRR